MHIFTFKVHRGDFRNALPIIRNNDGTYRIGNTNENASIMTNSEVNDAQEYFNEQLNGYILHISEVHIHN